MHPESKIAGDRNLEMAEREEIVFIFSTGVSVGGEGARIIGHVEVLSCRTSIELS